MKIVFHKEFEKRYRKLRSGEKRRFQEKRNLFFENEFHPLLENHPLRGKYQGYRSISIGGDLRVVYKRIKRDIFLFAKIGTHSELYA